MKPGARIEAAIEIVGQAEGSPRPLDEVVREWARGHRYAGSKDRAAIADMVFSVFRRRSELAHHMRDDGPRALVLAERALIGGLGADDLADICDGEGYAAGPLSGTERAALERAPEKELPDAVRGNYPGWLEDRIDFDPQAGLGREMALMSRRAPLDLRANTLKLGRQGALVRLNQELETRYPKRTGLRAEAGAFSPAAIRIPSAGSGIDLKRLALYEDGRIEVQDEGSQLAAMLACPRPGAQVIDLCAGAGGKSLAMAALMDNKGQIYACDIEPKRLEEARRRFQRAGVRNVQTHSLRDWDGTSGLDPDLIAFEATAELVLADVPCSGSGAWRRQPDAKWRLRPDWLERVAQVQARILDRAARLVRPGGRLAYVTCSVLRPENAGQIEAFLARNPAFKIQVSDTLWRDALGTEAPRSVLENGGGGPGLWLSPARTDTDGFYICVLTREGGAG